MNAIQELKDEIYNLGPRWNLFGKVDRMKYLIDQIEQGSINTSVGGPASASVSEGEQLGNEAGAKSVSDGVNLRCAKCELLGDLAPCDECWF